VRRLRIFRPIALRFEGDYLQPASIAHSEQPAPVDRIVFALIGPFFEGAPEPA